MDFLICLLFPSSEKHEHKLINGKIKSSNANALNIIVLLFLVLEELGAYAAVSEDLEEEAVRNVAAYDVGSLDVVFHRFEAGFDFGDHAAFYDALLGEVFDL